MQKESPMSPIADNNISYRSDINRVLAPHARYYGYGLESEALNSSVDHLADLINQAWDHETERLKSSTQPVHKSYIRVYREVYAKVGELSKEVWLACAENYAKSTGEKQKDYGRIVDYRFTRTILHAYERVCQTYPEFFGDYESFQKIKRFGPNEAKLIISQFTGVVDKDQLADAVFINGFGSIRKTISEKKRETIANLTQNIHTKTTYFTQRQLADRMGVSTSFLQSKIYRDILIWRARFSNYGQFYPTVEEIKKKFNSVPKSEIIAYHSFLTRDSFVEDIDLDNPVLDEVLELILKEVLNNELETIVPERAEVINNLFGLVDGEEKTLDQVAEDYGTTRERIRTAETKGIAQLRHPTRSLKLRDFLR